MSADDRPTSLTTVPNAMFGVVSDEQQESAGAGIQHLFVCSSLSKRAGIQVGGDLGVRITLTVSTIDHVG